MEKETYMVCAVDGDHDYNIIVQKVSDDKTRFTLEYSDNTSWTEKYRGKKIMTITDDGNDYYIPKIGKIVGSDVLVELAILTNFIKKYSPLLAPEYEIAQKQIIVKL